jgi:hypothetical protein
MVAWSPLGPVPESQGRVVVVLLLFTFVMALSDAPPMDSWPVNRHITLLESIVATEQPGKRGIRSPGPNSERQPFSAGNQQTGRLVGELGGRSRASRY